MIDGLVGFFSFPLTKTGFFSNLSRKEKKKWISLLWKKALGRLFVSVGVGLSVYMTFYITRLIECL